MQNSAGVILLEDNMPEKYKGHGRRKIPRRFRKAGSAHENRGENNLIMIITVSYSL